MAKFNANSNLKISNVAQLHEGIRKQVNKKVKKSYSSVQSSVAEVLRGMIRERLLASTVTQSLLSGKLRSDFGLTQTDANRTVNRIIEYVATNIQLSVKYAHRGKDVAVFTLDLLPMGVKVLSALPEGNYASTGKFGGGDVTWLTWLLTKGTQVVIGDFYVFDDPEGTTRAGSVMQKTSKKHPDGFRIDPGFAGTEEDNFVTRALTPIIPKIQKILFQKILEGLK
jgi:hypothetical protein